MKRTILTSALGAILIFASCDKKKEKVHNEEINVEQNLNEDTLQAPPLADNSEVSVDWPGVYEATVPCADCPGIKTILTLNQDKTFTISEEYLEKNVKSDDKGTFSWDSTGSTITLNGKETKYMYKVGENQLFQLDLQGKRIEGPNEMAFVFKKK